jgi:chromosomal replication initiator protein
MIYCKLYRFLLVKECYFISRSSTFVQIIWDDFLKIVKQEAGRHVVETWFKAAHLEAWNPETETVTIAVPNPFVKSWLKDHYEPLICTHLARLLHSNNLKCQFTVPEQQTLECTITPASVLHQEKIIEVVPPIMPVMVIEKKPTTTTTLVQTEEKDTSKKSFKNNLNEQYLFTNFIVGSSNALGHAAAVMVSKNLGKTYNPLLIYGQTGLGKTHLLHSIGNQAKKQNPHSIVFYQTTDHFITEFITSIRSNKHQQFRDRYQKVDLLLLDDIQFLSNKEQTQEIFFHIFNRLYEQGKQIVMTTDTFPKDIEGLQARLISRMEWGLVVDIQSPDLETKIAILQKKAEQHEIELPHDVAHFIANTIISNVRELEGALIRVSAFSALSNQPMSVELAQQMLLPCFNEKKKSGIMLATIAKQVSLFFNISIQELKSQKRHKSVAKPRQIALYLMKKMTFSSLQTIGEFMGGRDHSTVIHGISKINHLLETDQELTKEIALIEQEILKQ